MNRAHPFKFPGNWIGVLILLVELLVPAPIGAANMPKPGATCTKSGLTQTFGGKKFTCIKKGKKLVWSNGVAITVIKPTPSPTVTITPRPKCTAAPDKPVLETNWNENGVRFTIKKDYTNQPINDLFVSHTFYDTISSKWTPPVSEHLELNQDFAREFKALSGFSLVNFVIGATNNCGLSDYAVVTVPLAIEIKDELKSYSTRKTLPVWAKISSLSTFFESNNKLAQEFESLTPEVCIVNQNSLIPKTVGTCNLLARSLTKFNVTGVNSAYYSFDIIAGEDARTTKDRPDDFIGYQMKPVYVIPADVEDMYSDVNGYIDMLINGGNDFLKAELGSKLAVDTFNNQYDVAVLKTKKTLDQIRTDSFLTDDLMREMGVTKNFPNNQKMYIFFVEVDRVMEKYCGYAPMPGMASIVSVASTNIGDLCFGSSKNLRIYAMKTWVHETFHNFGVDHTPDDPCDLMRGYENKGTCETLTTTIDRSNTRYVNSNKQGADVLKQPYWTK